MMSNPFFSIATWNINSLRVRLPHVLNWLTVNKPHILALQEIKIPSNDFPFAEFKRLGYEALVNGQKTYNGVALLTRDAAQNVVFDFPYYDDLQRRMLAITVCNKRIINLYVPNGESVNSPKYQYKLVWLSHLKKFLQNELTTGLETIVLGDFNIAPSEKDVHNPLLWQNRVLFSEAERKQLQHLLDLGLVDCFRFKNEHAMEFSWWDYRLNSFKRNLGLRIDLILASKKTADKCIDCFIDKKERSLERPSDHAPVVAKFKLDL